MAKLCFRPREFKPEALAIVAQANAIDALPPDELQRLVREAIEPYIDRDAWEEAESEVEEGRTRMHEALEGVRL